MSRPARGFWPMRDLPTVLWLLATVVSTLVHPFIPAPRWLMIHLLVLGAVGHAILVWSRYFADTLLRGPATPRGEQTIRLALFNLGVVLVVAGMLADVWLLVLAGACLVVVAVGWHGVVLAVHLRRALAARFAPTVRYYVAAASLLPVGVGLGAWLARDLASPMHEQARAAHVALNVFGWIGLTVLGTLVTLWPTILRTRIVEGAEAAARRALPVLVTGVVVLTASALAGLRWGYVVGLAGYLLAVLLLGLPMVRTARVKHPTSYAAWSVLAAYAWLVGCLASLVVTVSLADDWLEVDRALSTLTPFLAAGFAAQVLLGASSYLIPVVLGGGPTAVRATNAVFDAGAPWRLVVANVGLLVCALPAPSLVRVVVSVLVLGALASFVPLLFVALRTSRRARQAPASASARPDGPAAPDGERPRGQRTGMAAAGLATVLLAIALAAAIDPAALDRPASSAQADAVATGQTTEVEVVARGMRFEPSKIRVPAGDRLVITVHNHDEGDVHDLVLETGAETGRLSPGESATLDAGVVGRDLDGWCSIVGHRQMGMVLAVEVVGEPVVDGPETVQEQEHDHGSGHLQDDSSPGAAHDLSADPGPGFEAVDATLPPLPDGSGRTVHRHTFTITETELEVAPGVRQNRWTYNGTAPGPTLHGRVGDVFDLTLVNDGTIGHSIDFHAGALAPDRPMRTIAPGERLRYRFTATRAGIWMYHCSTMPMATHIAAGMFGAVVIEPADLPEVDRSYVLVQSELHLGEQGGQLDVDKLLDDRPDLMAFNGYAHQYAHDPLPVRVGERVRVWLLAAGPNRALSFHVVGGQFDRVWSEGDWRLGDARSPAQDTGAQALGLMAAQGGFVELTFDEAGTYPFVNHVMVDGERGARGAFAVAP